MLLPPFFKTGAHFIYDILCLAFFAASLLFLCREKWVPFYLCIALGFINKETMCVVSIPFVIFMWKKLPRKQLLAHLGVQLALFVGIRIVLLALYDPPRPIGPFDGFLRPYLSRNLLHIWKSRILYDWSSLVSVSLIAILVLRSFGKRPLLLRAGALIIAPLFAGYVKGGLWGEIRVFYELFPVFFLLGYASSLELLGADVRVRAGQYGGPILWNRRSADWSWVLFAVSVGVFALAVVCVALATNF